MEIAEDHLLSRLRRRLAGLVAFNARRAHPEHRTAERRVAALHKANARLRHQLAEHERGCRDLDRFFNFSLDLLCIAGFDGYFKRLNPAFSRTLGFTDEELMAHPFHWFVHEDDRAATEAEFDKLAMGAPTIYFENRYRCKDGRYRWLGWTAHPVPEKALIYAVARDITARKRIEEALQESEKRYRTLVEHAPDSIVVLDMESGRFVDCNREAERLFGLPREQLLQRDPVMMSPEFQPDGRPSAEAAYEEIHRAINGEVPYFEWTHRNAQGRDFPCELRLVRLPSAERVLVRGSIMDITARKHAEQALARKAEELARSNEDLEQFAYVASHDLQEPLNTISSFVQLLHQRYQGRLDDDADTFIGYIVDGAHRMQALIKDLLAYARVGRTEIERARFDTGKVFEQVVAGMQHTLAGAEVTCGALPTLEGDATQFGLVLQNLISNGVKFRGAEPPRIHVWAEADHGTWRFGVRDNGIGIKATYHDRIFEVFRRLHTPRQYAGTGIGLAVCKKIVERHGGKIWVASEEGSGATFYFTLPA